MHEGKALKQTIDLSDYKIDQIIEITGISRGQLYNLYKEEEIKDEWKARLKKLKLNYPWSTKSTNITIEPKPIPVYDVDFTAGHVTQLQDFPELIVGYVHFASFKNCIAFVKVKGNSMFPTFTAGDMIGLEPQPDLKYIEYGQPYGIVTKTGLSLVKTIRKGADDENLILRSNNKEFDDISIHKKDILRLYKAHGPIRDAFY
jgi:hypothetical protein